MTTITMNYSLFILYFRNIKLNFELIYIHILRILKVAKKTILSLLLKCWVVNDLYILKISFFPFFRRKKKKCKGLKYNSLIFCILLCIVFEPQNRESGLAPKTALKTRCFKMWHSKGGSQMPSHFSLWHLL